MVVHNKNKKSTKMTGKRKKTESNDVPLESTIGDDDMPAFPRGGTPLSKSEIEEVKAQVDAEFEAEVNQKGKGKQPRRKKQKVSNSFEDDTYGVVSGISGKLPKFAHGLTSKNIALGTKMWGIITEINKKDLVVSLPSGLYGIVVASEAFDLPLESTEGIRGDEDKKNEDMNASLEEVFTIGQIVSCVICKLEKNEARGSSKDNTKIWLSLRLSLLYKGLTIDAVQEGMIMTGYIKSIEAHGYVLSFGLSSFTGFLPHGNVADYGCFGWKKGQRVQGTVSCVNRETGLISMQADPALVSSAVVEDHRGLSLDLLLPGVMVHARVQAVLHNGLLLSFLTYFTGTVDVFNLPDTFPDSKWQEKFSENSKLKARILYVNPASKVIGLTLNPYLIQNQHPPLGVRVGDIFENVKVKRIDHGVGLLVELPSKPKSTPAYVNINKASDEHIEKLEKKFKEGSKVSARVLGCRFTEGLAIATLKASVLEQTVFRYSDMKPGMCTKAKVVKVEHDGAIVELPNGLKAMCPLKHMSEFEISGPRKKFQPGVELKFRILGCKDKRITVTHKKTMVTSKHKVLASYEDAFEGFATHGWIDGISSHGCFVKFYNGVKGFARRSELGIDPGQDHRLAFHIGQVVKCRVISSNSELRKLDLSFTSSSDRPHIVSDIPRDIKVGSILSGLVDNISSSAILVDVIVGQRFARGTIAIEHLADHPGHAEEIRSKLKQGYKFDRLLVIDLGSHKIILSAKHSLIESSSSLPSNISELRLQEVHQGYICNIIEGGAFVKFLGNLTGFVPKSKGFDNVDKDYGSLYVGKSVRVQIQNVNRETKKISLSMKQSDCFSTNATLIQGYFLEEEMIADLQSAHSGGSDVNWTKDFVIGSCVTGEVQQIKEYGVIVNIQGNKDIVGLISHYQMGGVSMEVGAVVEACIIDVVKSEVLIDLSLKRELIERKKKKGSGEKTLKQKRQKLEKCTQLQLWQTVSAVVELVKDEYLVLSLPEFDWAIAFASTRDYNMCLDPHEHYRLGQRVKATVAMLPDASACGRLLLLLSLFNNQTSIKKSKQTRIRTIRSDLKEADVKNEIGRLVKERSAECEDSNVAKKEMISSDTKDSSPVAKEVDVDAEELHEGQIIDRRISKIISGTGLQIDVGKRKYGIVRLPEIRDDFPEDPLEGFRKGNIVSCRVLKIKKYHNDKCSMELSMRGLSEGCRNSNKDGNCSDVDLLGQSSGERILSLEPGTEVKGYVRSFSGTLMFVMLSFDLDGVVHIGDIVDSFTRLEDAKKRYPQGKLVTGRILSVEPLSRRVRITLKRNYDIKNTHDSQIAVENPLESKDFNEKPLNSEVVEEQPCSKKEKPKRKAKKPIDKYHAGDIVYGTIKDVKNGGIYVTLDDSPLVAFCSLENLTDNRIVDMHKDYTAGQRIKAKVLKVDRRKKVFILAMKHSLLMNEENEDNASDKEDRIGKASEQIAEDNFGRSDGEEHEPNENGDREDTSNDIFKSWNSMNANTSKSDIRPLEVDFDTDAPLSVAAANDSADTGDAAQVILQNDTNGKLKRKEKKRRREERELEIAAAEKKRLEGDRPPESIDEYEQLVRASPNSSIVWIKYMAYLLSVAAVDKARDIAERALQTISFREEEEKLNVWVAYMNLENAYGSPPNESVGKVFQRALQYCDPKKVHIALLGLYEKTGQQDLAEQLLKGMSKRFKTSAKVWLRYLQNLLQHGSDSTQTVLNRALLSLPHHKHIKVISKAATLEFKIGSPERGRTLFEGVLRNYPKRTDLWSVYLDQEIRKGDAAVIRALFERVTCLELPPKKMKFLFKKYLDYEKSHGDESRVEYVKKKAMEYVESKAG